MKVLHLNACTRSFVVRLRNITVCCCIFSFSTNLLRGADWEGATVTRELYDDTSGFCSSYGASVALSLTRNGCRIAARVGNFDDGYAICVDGVTGPRYERIAEETPVFSDNGASVAYCARKSDGWCWVINNVEGPVFKEAITPTSFAFSPDGKRHAYVAKDSKQLFLVVDGKITAGGKNQREIPFDIAPVFSPDAKRLAYCEVDFESEFAAEIGKGRMRVIVNGEPNPLYPRASGGAGAEGLKKQFLINKCSRPHAIFHG